MLVLLLRSSGFLEALDQARIHRRPLRHSARWNQSPSTKNLDFSLVFQGFWHFFHFLGDLGAILDHHGLQDASKTAQDTSRGLQTPSRCPRSPPRRLQDRPRGFQEAPRRFQDGQDRFQDASKAVQQASKCLPGAKISSKPVKTSPKGLQMPPRRSISLPRPSKNVRKLFQELTSPPGSCQVLAEFQNAPDISMQWPSTMV